MPLATPGFYLLTLLLLTFAGMLWILRYRHPGRRRGLEGFFEGATVDLGFLIFGFALVVALVILDAPGNRTALALYEVVVGGYWFTFSIPIVTVSSSIHQRSRGGIPWLIPSLLVATALFAGLFGFYYATV
jgi:hypothetical protein